MVLPLYKMIERHLQTAIEDEDLRHESFLGLKNGLKAGLKKTKKHLDKALEGDYPLLGAGMWFNIYTPSFFELINLPSIASVYPPRIFSKLCSLGPNARNTCTCTT
jgi:hypothetical protein